MNVFIRRYDDHYQWFVTSEEAVKAEVNEGTLEDLGSYYKSHENIKHWVLVAPALDVASKAISFNEKEKRHINKALPYILEDELLTEADDLHYVADKPEATSVNVVAVDKRIMATWVAELDSVGVAPTHCIPESKFLADTDADWQILYRHGEFIVRTINVNENESQQCAALSAEHFALSMELLTDNYSDLPSSIELVIEDEEALEEAGQYIPDAIQQLVTARQYNYADMLQLHFTNKVKLWNLLKGQFAYTAQWMSKLLYWRWVIAGFVAIFCVHTTMVYVDYLDLKKKNAAIKAQMDTTIRQVFPKGVIVDHRRQLSAELKRLKSTGSGNKFTKQLSQVGAVLAKHSVTSLSSMSYNNGSGQLKIDFIVNDYDQLESIIAGLKGAGYAAEIQDSNAQDDKLRAKIKITVNEG